MSLIVAAFGFGLVSMSIIAISAVGFTMQFGITNMINLAYGQVMIASAYAAYTVNNAGVSIWLALPVGAIFGAVFSFLLNRLIYAPFQRKGTNLIGMVIISLAVSLVIANALLPIVGTYSVSYHQNPGTTYNLGSIALTGEQLAIIAVAIVVMLAIHALLRFTQAGQGDASHRRQPDSRPELRHPHGPRRGPRVAHHRRTLRRRRHGCGHELRLVLGGERL